MAATRRCAFLVAAAVLVFGATGADAAKKITVNMKDNPGTGSYFFDPAYIAVGRGDTVRWVNMGSVSHTSTSYEGLWDSGLLSPGQSFTKVMTTLGPHQYFCGPHEFLGMVGAVSVLAHDRIEIAMKDNIATSTFFFDPDNVTASPGDTIKWTNMGQATHTATSGTAGDPDEGDLFSSGNVPPGGMFTWIVAETSAVIHFHCIPHDAFGMQGDITVQPTGVPPAPITGGRPLRATPSPARGAVSVAFVLERAGEVRLDVLDAQGRMVAPLAAGAYPAGPSALVWRGTAADGRPAPDGMYVLRLEADGHRRYERFLRLR